MRQSRRGCFYQNKEPKYIWKVYDIGTQLTGGTTGSISIRKTRTKMTSTEFTYSNGTFTLTNPKSKTITNLSVGDYIVDIRTTTAGANITSGSAIYKVTGKSGSSNIILSYTEYTSMKNIQGSTYYYDVASDTLDYPIDGEQDGYWYVMVKGEKEMYVWDVYNVSTKYGYKESSKSATVNFVSGNSIYMASSYSFNKSSGTFTLNNPVSTRWTSSYADILGISNISDGPYWMKNSDYGSYVMTEMLTEGTLTPTLELSGTQKYAVTDESAITYIKGTSTGTTVESDSNTLYPQDGAQGNYWYTYSHSYMKKFDNR